MYIGNQSLTYKKPVIRVKSMTYQLPVHAYFYVYVEFIVLHLVLSKTTFIRQILFISLRSNIVDRTIIYRIITYLSIQSNIIIFD